MDIIRRSDKATGGITPEEKVRLDAHARLWIQRALRTESIEPDKITAAIHDLYSAANLRRPRVVIAPSPLVMALAGGFASAIWWARKHGVPTRAATRAATNAATDAATDAATYAATNAATDDATDAATDAATNAATHAATRAATNAATNSATRDATNAATRAATRAATNSATAVATYAATYAATRAATRAATDDATDDATNVATYAATNAATRAATRAATEVATRAATEVATNAATEVATNAATEVATDDGCAWVQRLAVEIGGEALAPLMLSCARAWARPHQGGNMWAGWVCYLTAFRDVLGLQLPECEKFAAWEQAAIHGGYRWMHEEFCMVSDFPELLLTDDRGRPHSEVGPSHLWRDGWSLYHWHGVRVPAHWIEDRDNLDPREVIASENVEQRAAGAQIVGWPKMMGVLEARVIDGDPDTEIGALIELTLPGLDEPGRFLQARCPRNGTICEGVPRISDIDDLPINTALAAQAWRLGDPQAEFIPPTTRT